MPNRSISQVLKDHSLVSTGPKATVRDAAVMMAEKHVTAIAIMDDAGKLVGIFSEHDLLTRVVAPGLDPEEILLDDVMSPHPVTINLTDKVRLAMAEMLDNQLRHLPVLDQGKVVGMLSIRDFVGPEIYELQQVAEFEERIWENAL